MIKDKINKERKEKAKNIAFKILHGVSYALSTCFIATCIVACASSGAKKSDSPKAQYEPRLQYRIEGELDSQSESESVSYPIYDDEQTEITLNSYQLNNYKFVNLADLFNEYETSTFASELTLTYNNSFDIELVDFGHYDSIQFSNNIYEVDINLFIDSETDSVDYSSYGKFYLFDLLTSQSNINFESDLLIHCGNSYSLIKQAIELDIQANAPINSVDDIFTAISDTITNFVIALNSGITAIVGLFWNSTSSALTPLGVLTTIVVGVALAYFVFRLIIGLIRLRG